MRITTAIKKLEEMLAKNPKGEVSIKKLKPKKKKRVPKRLLSSTLKAWAQEKSKDGGSFSLMDAIRYYERIGGSAGVTTVLFRLRQIGARSVTGLLPETHLKARWACAKDVTTGAIRELIEQDPSFKDRYMAARRRAIEQGRLAPDPFEKVVFIKSHGKRGELWVETNDEDRGRHIRLQVKPQPGFVLASN